jgi:hypothetical protein
MTVTTAKVVANANASGALLTYRKARLIKDALHWRNRRGVRKYQIKKYALSLT